MSILDAPNPRDGEVISARVNAMLFSFAKALARSHGLNCYVDSTGQIIFRDRVSIATPGKLFLVKQELADYLRCWAWNDETGLPADETDVLVAKPYKLRKTPFDGLTIAGLTYNYLSVLQRRVTNADGIVEMQRIACAYQVGSGAYLGDVIRASKPEGGVRVRVDAAPAALTRIDWMDDNTDARQWMEI